MGQFISDNQALIVGLSGAAVGILAWFGGPLRWAWRLIFGKRSEPAPMNPANSPSINQTVENSSQTAQVGHARDVTIKQGGATEDIAAGIARGLTEVFGKERQELEGRLQAKDQEIAALTAAVEDLRARAAQPNAPQRFEDALAKLSNNDTAAAEAIFQEVLEQKKAEGDAANKEAAAAARHLGALAFLHDTEKALAAYVQAVALDPDNPDGWNQLGNLLSRKGTLAEAEDAYQRVLDLGKQARNREAIAVASGNLGMIYEVQGDLDRAEEFVRKSLVLYDELGSKEGMASDYGNLGVIYQARGDLEEAEDLYRKSLALNEEVGGKEGTANAYGNLGLIYEARGDLDKAEEYLRKSLSFNMELCRKLEMASDYGNLGVIYRTQGDLDRAEEYCGKSLTISEELGRKGGVASQYGNLGSISLDRSDQTKACEFWAKAKALFDEIGAKDGAEQTAKLMRDAGCP